MKNEKEFVSNLKSCPELEYIYLHIRGALISDESVAMLAGMKEQLEILLNLDDPKDFMAEELAEKFLKLIDSLGDKVTHLYWGIANWNERFTSPLWHLIDKCQTLVSLSFRNYLLYECPKFRDAKLGLIPLFASKEQAQKLRSLSLCGEFDESILGPIFNNCVNLDKLAIVSCPQLSDYHLRELAGRGIRLSHIRLCGCPDITDDGAIPLLRNSGSKLLFFDADQSARITDLAYKAEIEFCRYARWFLFRNQELKALAIWKNFVQVPLATHHLTFVTCHYR